MNFDQWLIKIEQCHVNEIELGLERCHKVLSHLLPNKLPNKSSNKSSSKLKCKIITIAGTNGKGSTVAVLEALALASGKSVLAFTSPHLLDYRERLRFNGNWLSKEQHVEYFECIEQSRDNQPLTYFEYSTLSAFCAAEKLQPDLLILETGLGGRLDAVNIVKADVSIITTVDYDHQEWLGDDLESIAREKAGIIHSDGLAVIGDPSFPQVIVEEIKQRTSHLQLANQDFHYQQSLETWQWDNADYGPWQFQSLSFPCANAAAAFHAWSLLYNQQSHTQQLFAKALNHLQLTARFEIIDVKPTLILDVAHNPQAFRIQSALLDEHPCSGKTHLILGILKDKNLLQSIDVLKAHADFWYLTDVDTKRGYLAENLQQSLSSEGISKQQISCHKTPIDAYKDACHKAAHNDRIIVTGSFYTVAPIVKLLNDRKSKSKHRG